MRSSHVPLITQYMRDGVREMLWLALRDAQRVDLREAVAR